jgi:hypothetical protein
MAQGDLFKNFMSSGGVLQEAYEKGVVSLERMRDIQDEMNEQASNAAKVKKAMWKADFKGQKITDRLASTGRKIVEHTKKINEMKKQQLITEKELAKIDEKIKNSADGSRYQKALIKQYDATRLTYEKNKASLALMKKATPILGKLGGFGGGIAEALGSLAGVIPIIGGIISGLMKLGSAIFGMIIAPFKKGFELFLQTQSLVGNLAADIGLTAAQSKNLLNNVVGMSIAAMKFGGSMEDVISIYRKFSEATGKNRAFDAQEIAAIVELGKGTGLGVEGAASMATSFDNIGISLSKTIKLTDKARGLAARYNVNVTEVLKSYQGLVESLTGIGFGKGLDNLTKLAAKAQAIRFDIVGSTKAFADTFFDPEKAVEASAKMQLLGGKFAASFGDPMQLAFESMNDPTALAEKFAKTLQGVVAKDKMGNFFIPPADRKMLKIAAETLGQDYEMATKSAIEQAKITDKMVALNKAGFNMMGIKEDDKPALAALMKMNKDNKYEIQMSDGTTKLLENITDKNQLNAILDNRKKNEQAAQGRMNLMERLENMINRFTLGFTNIFQKIFANMDFDSFLNQLESLGESLAKTIFPAISDMFNNKGTFKKVFDDVIASVTNIVGAISEIWKGKGTFMEKVIDSFAKLFTGVWDLIIPYLKSTVGYLFKAIGEASGSDTVKVWGEKMILEAGSQKKVLNDLVGQNEKQAMVQHINQNKTNLSGSQMGDMVSAGITGAGIGAGLFALGTLLDMTGIGAAIGLPMQAIGAALGSTSLLGSAAIGATVAGGSSYVGSKISNMSNPDYQAPTPTYDVKDALITPHGIIRGDKGDMWMALQANGMGSSSGNSMGMGSTNSMQHSGTITIKSEDGKVVTWDQMYSARDILGGRIASINEGHKGGFGNYQNSNISPLQPLMV